MKITLVQCAPPDQPGSMKAFGQMLEQALSAKSGDTLSLASAAFHDTRSGASMWQHHRWRLRNAHRVFAGQRDRWLHLLDGSMGALIPRRYWSRMLVSVHDLIPALILNGELPGPSPSLPARWLIRRSLTMFRNCRALHTVSASTRADLERLTGRRDITVIPLAVRDLGRDESAMVLPERFVLHIGNNAAYKNRKGVLEVFDRLRDLNDVHLVMAGPAPTTELLQRAATIPRVQFISNVSDRQLTTLYRRASLLLFPSLYEGFGMPLLEAMAQGCPVVCSTAGPLPEVAGDAALMASPGDVDALAAHVRRFLLDAMVRDDYIARGKFRASTFTLDRMGEQFMDWYQRSTDKH